MIQAFPAQQRTLRARFGQLLVLGHDRELVLGGKIAPFGSIGPSGVIHYANDVGNPLKAVTRYMTVTYQRSRDERRSAATYYGRNTPLMALKQTWQLPILDVVEHMV